MLHPACVRTMSHAQMRGPLARAAASWTSDSRTSQGRYSDESLMLGRGVGQLQDDGNGDRERVRQAGSAPDDRGGPQWRWCWRRCSAILRRKTSGLCETSGAVGSPPQPVWASGAQCGRDQTQ